MPPTPAQPADPQQALAALDHTPYGPLLRDTTSRRRLVYEAMRRSPHPAIRDLGEQLAAGQLTPGDLLSQPAYRDLAHRARTVADRLNLDDLAHRARTLADNQQLTGDLDRDLHPHPQAHPDPRPDNGADRERPDEPPSGHSPTPRDHQR